MTDRRHAKALAEVDKRDDAWFRSHSVGGAEQSAIDKLARERDVISAQMNLKQLSPGELQQAQFRLAEIDLQTAQLNQQMGEAEDALQILKPMIFDMQTAGRSWAQITQTVAWEMQRMTGNTAIQPLPLSGFAGGFAKGGMIPRGQFGIVGEKGPEFIKGPADIIPMQAAPAAVTHHNDNSTREIHAPISVTVMAPEVGGGSRESEREYGRRVAQAAAYDLREMGVI